MACVSTCLILSPRLTQVGLSSKTPFLIRLRSPVDCYSFPGISTERCLSTRRKFTRHGIAVVKAASLDKVSGAIKPGGLVESDRLPTDVRKRAMQAVDECGRRVTVGDVASRAGLNVTEAQNALQAIAADTDGFLEVSDEGDVLYVFPKDYRTKLAAKSFRIQIEPFLEKAKGAIDYLARVSFGTALIASVVIVYASIIVLLSSSKSEDDDDRQRRRGRGYDSGSNFYINSDPNYYNRREDEEQGMNFIESVFSFVFGDGDPNQGIEEERWQMIGQYITSRGGVVAADELAPYLDVPSSKSATNDESYILPVLLRFDGQPELDEEGNILYRFPSLQRTASGSSRRNEDVGKWFDWVADMEKFFKEKKWQFSRTRTSQRAMVIGLGAVNLFGVIVLNALLMEMAVTPSGFLTFVKNIYPLLQIYAGSFFAIPLIRWFSIKRKNKQIENRNKARLQFAKALESPDIALRRKLLSARDMAQNTVIGKERIVYSTDRDMMEQNYEQTNGTEDSKSWKNQIEMKSHLLPDAKLLSGRLYYLLPTTMIKKKVNKKMTHLLPDAKLLSGRHYYLLPTTMIKKKVNKKVTFANPEVEDEERSLREDDATSESNINNNIDGDDNKNVSVVRMKIVVNKQELEKLLQGGSVHEMMHQTLEKQRLLTDDDDDDLDECNRGWRPVLDSIPESESLRRT